MIKGIMPEVTENSLEPVRTIRLEKEGVKSGSSLDSGEIMLETVTNFRLSLFAAFVLSMCSAFYTGSCSVSSSFK